MQYCSLQHWTLLLPPDTSTAECHFHFGPATSFFLQLLVIALYSSPVAYWTPSDLEGSSSGAISFCLFILFMGFSWQEYWSILQWTVFCQTHPRFCESEPAFAPSWDAYTYIKFESDAYNTPSPIILWRALRWSLTPVSPQLWEVARFHKGCLQCVLLMKGFVHFLVNHQILFKKYLFIWLYWVLVVALGISVAARRIFLAVLCGI